jgi:hypothetical protein
MQADVGVNKLADINLLTWAATGLTIAKNKIAGNRFIQQKESVE